MMKPIDSRRTDLYNSLIGLHANDLPKMRDNRVFLTWRDTTVNSGLCFNDRVPIGYVVGGW